MDTRSVSGGTTTSTLSYVSLIGDRAKLLQEECAELLLERTRLLLERQRFLERAQALLIAQQSLVKHQQALLLAMRTVPYRETFQSLAEQHRLLVLSHQTAVTMYRWLTLHAVQGREVEVGQHTASVKHELASSESVTGDTKDGLQEYLLH
jgi:hypothetical protein